MKHTLTALALAGLTASAPVLAESPAVEAMEEYLMFAGAHAGIILPAQLPPEEWDNVTFIDTRDAGQFEAGHITGARHVEWREVLSRRDAIPADRPVIVYCNTGSLSAQAGFALRVAGMDNVRILQGGLEAWRAEHGEAGID